MHITDDDANASIVTRDKTDNGSLFREIRDRLNPSMTAALLAYDRLHQDGHAAWKYLCSNAAAAANDATRLVEIQAAALKERLADLKFEPVFPRRPKLHILENQILTKICFADFN